MGILTASDVERMMDPGEVRGAAQMTSCDFPVQSTVSNVSIHDHYIDPSNYFYGATDTPGVSISMSTIQDRGVAERQEIYHIIKALSNPDPDAISEGDYESALIWLKNNERFRP